MSHSRGTVGRSVVGFCFLLVLRFYYLASKNGVVQSAYSLEFGKKTARQVLRFIYVNSLNVPVYFQHVMTIVTTVLLSLNKQNFDNSVAQEFIFIRKLIRAITVFL